MKYNNKGFSILFAIIFVILISLMVLYILEYMIPFSRDTKGIENSSASYYEAIKGLEDGLYFVKDNELIDKGITIVDNSEYTLKARISGGAGDDSLPLPGEGNSEYDKNFNIVKSGSPIQLEIGSGSIANFNNVKLFIRSPDTHSGGTTDVLPSTDDIVVNWQLSSNSNTLNASGSSFITYNNLIGNDLINNSTNANDIKLLSGWNLINNSTESFQDFYNGNCGGSNKCSLKISVVNSLKSSVGTPLPYLEWRMDFPSNSVAKRFFEIKASGKISGFKKSLELRKTQQTVIQAFDFTVIQ